MYKQLHIIAIFFGVWFIASFLNGLLSGISIALLDNSASINAGGDIGLSIIFSYLFSIPMVGFVWLVAAIAQLAGKNGEPLFRLILNTAFFCALTAAIVFITTIGTEFKAARYVVGLCIIVSALSAVLVFRIQLKKIE